MTESGSNAPPPPPYERPRFARPDKPRIIAGVSGALSREFGIEVLWVRVAFVVLTIFGGTGIALYVLGILAIPREDEHESALHRWFEGRDRRLVIVAIVVAIVLYGWLFGDWDSGWRHGWFPGGWVVIVVGALLLVGPRLGRHHDRTTETNPPPVPYGPGAPGPTAPGPTASTLAAETAPTPDPTADAERAAAREARRARTHRRWRIFVATVASVVLLFVAGLVTAVATGALPIGWGWGDRSYHPAQVSELRHYRLFAGAQNIDLTGLQLRDGQRTTVTVAQRFGEVHIIVPTGARVDFRTHVRAGEIELLDQRASGWSAAQPLKADTPPGWTGGPMIVLHVNLTAGELYVERGEP